MFKVGDIVRFIVPLENYTKTQPIKGCVYTIKYFSSIVAPHDEICLVELPNLGTWKVSRFELVSTSTSALPTGQPHTVYVPQPFPSQPSQQDLFTIYSTFLDAMPPP